MNYLFFLVYVLVSCLQLVSASSYIRPDVVSSNPLYFRMIPYDNPDNYIAVEPFFMRMYDAQKVNQSLILHGKSKLVLNQQGLGDINPVWLNLMSNSVLANYHSTITFQPVLQQAGVLLHWYDQVGNLFAEIKTALLQCTSGIKISEVGGGNGLLPGIGNAQQAYMQPDWRYGKIGELQQVVGLDDIEFHLGGVYKVSNAAESYRLHFAGFGLVQIPTGSGTKAEWLFEPLVGTNHWGLGFGFETLITCDYEIAGMIAANYRYLIPSWQTRSFDLMNNGQWSRYLGLQPLYGLPRAAATLSVPGINYMTQSAHIQGRSQVELYARLQKKFAHCYLELSYNLSCTEQETIDQIDALPLEYGIYSLTNPAGGAGGVTTASQAFIYQAQTPLDPLSAAQSISTQNFNRLSGAMQTYATNRFGVRLEVQQHHMTYGFGALLDVGLTESAISSWSVWAQLGFLFNGYDTDEIQINCDDSMIFNQLSDPIISHNYDDNDLMPVTHQTDQQVCLSDDPICESTDSIHDIQQDMIVFNIPDENEHILEQGSLSDIEPLESYQQEDQDDQLELVIIDEDQFMPETDFQFPDELDEHDEHESVVIQNYTVEQIEKIYMPKSEFNF